MLNRNLSILRFIAIAGCIEIPLVLSYFWMSGDFSVPRFNVWPISEWLINYQAGFIRRGLVGEILLRIYGPGELIKPLYIVMFYSYAIYVGVFLWVYLKSRIRNANILLVSILIQGGIFHMGMSADFYTRKENIFLIFFGIQCLLYLQIKSVPISSQKYWLAAYLSLLFMVTPILVLVHEAYLFLSLPISILLLWILAIERPQDKYLPLTAALLFSETLIVFLICSVFHGDVSMSQLIWDSLPFIDRLKLSSSAPYSTFGAIGSLGWGLDQHLSTIYGVFSSGGIFVWIFFACGNALVLAYIYLAMQSPRVNRAPSQYLRWILLGFLVLLPMFLVACDWGRWIATISNQLILLMFTLRQSDIFYKPDLNPLRQRLSSIKCTIGMAGLFTLCIIYGLAFQMPECCADYRVNSYFYMVFSIFHTN